MKFALAPFAPLILFMGCTSPGPYPSLLPRAAERSGFQEPDAPAPTAAVPDPTLDARITAMGSKLKDAAARFDSAAVSAERLVRAANKAAAGSDQWLDAQTALATLDGLRAETLEGLTDIEQLAAERAAALQADYPALDAAIATARKNTDEQAERIAALQAMLAPA